MRVDKRVLEVDKSILSVKGDSLLCEIIVLGKTILPY